MATLLRLVGAGQPPDRPTRRKGTRSRALSLTSAEANALRASIRNLARVRFGTLKKLADMLGVEPEILTSKRRRPSPGLAVAVARVCDVSIDSVLGRTGLALVPSSAPVEKGGA